MPISFNNFKSLLAMNIYAVFIAAVIAATFNLQAFAQEDNATPATSTDSKGAADNAPTPTPKPTPIPILNNKLKQEAPQPITGILQDGTNMEISDDGIVTLSNTDGSKSTAPDGVYTLKDETTFAVKDGKKTDQ